MIQQDLFANVIAAYIDSPTGILSNEDLYRTAGHGFDLKKKVPIGVAQELHNPSKRQMRWHQQTLKQMGIIEHVGRGQWQLTQASGKDLQQATTESRMIAFSTDLGVAIWARNESVFPQLDEPIHLCITSPPYPLRNARAYGNPSAAEYVDFISNSLEPIVRGLIPGGSIVLNISNDIFESKSPARSLYVERMVIALHDRLGLHLMDRIPWINLSKPPGPTYWACVNRVQLSSCYEPIYWFTNDPLKVRSDNRRVLEEHTVKHQKLMASGGEHRNASYGNGAYQIRDGKSFSTQTSGKIPRNAIQKGHSCPDTLAYRRAANELGIQKHGAMQPTSIPDFFIRFLTEPGELVVDLFGGTAKTGLAAERLGRRWLVTEWMLSYLRGGAEHFAMKPGFAATF